MDNAISAEGIPLTDYARIQQVVAAAGALPKAPAMHPEGHNAFWEGARPWLVLLGATALTAIGTYVIGKDSIDHFSQGHGTWTDGLVVGVSVGLGTLLDAAIVISGMRTHQEKGAWAWLARLMFVLCLGVEMMTLAYFYKIIQPESIPPDVSALVDGIHNLLYFFRAGLPPLIVAFLAVAVRNLVFTQADRKRQMKELTGGRLMNLEARLADPANGEDKVQMVREYETQLYLFEYASDATVDEKAANTALINKFKEIWDVGKTNAEAALREEVERLRTQIVADKAGLLGMFERAVLFLFAQQRLPDEMVALAPALGDIDWSRLFTGQTEADDEEDPLSMNRTDRKPPTAPKPNSLAFLTLLKNTAREMLLSRQPVTVYALTQRLSVTQEELLDAIGRVVSQSRNKLRPGQEVTDHAVQALGMLLEESATR